jgi:hypothetical protein
MEEDNKERKTWVKQSYEVAKELAANAVVRRIVVVVVSYWASTTEFAGLWQEVRGALQW